ncbi:MAG: PhnD/SsuA/transferrin family substrate-binding protein [Verrucomicrobia bacterium]|nr:PhnD/SsuA/transferrin family substrate-binding protein [Verrucomicrobiota bacterium]
MNGVTHPQRTGLILAMALAALPFGTVAQESSTFRIGFSSASFGEVNENDAAAAVRVWAQALATERGIPADPQPKILRSVSEIAAALTNKLIDAINMTTGEYAALQGRVALQHCVVSVKNKVITEEYVLLVHRASGLERLSDLRGRKLGLLQSARASLAPAWLDLLLAKEGLGLPANFCGQMISSSKITKAILPVFFGQLDACLVTRNGFETMIELNPQVSQQLKILASSPPLVPVVFCFRADYTSAVRNKLLGEISRWHTSPAGRQILTIFQTDSLEERPVSCLDSALEMVAAHQRLCGETNSGKAKGRAE